MREEVIKKGIRKGHLRIATREEWDKVVLHPAFLQVTKKDAKRETGQIVGHHKLQKGARPEQVRKSTDIIQRGYPTGEKAINNPGSH